MENPKVKIDTITDWLTKQVKSKNPIAPTLWIESAEKLNMLLGDEQEYLYNLAQIVAIKKVELMEAGDSAAKAKIKVEALEENKQFLIQKARIDRIIDKKNKYGILTINIAML